ncbi:LCP family protein [Pseudonocardia adelaidensis]|uniref:LCP family protein n=1 Tax=Pseudonocardia adelaidensis TaxID=648754 RepID=A0ABP9P530_9PSEU
MDARRTVRAAVRVGTALASAAVLVATGFVWSLHQRVDTGAVSSAAAIPTPRPTPAGEAFTALLVGLDARTDAQGEPLPPAMLDALHAGPDEGQLHTDTIILVHVPAKQGEPAAAISIPRDSFVPIAGGRGTHKINSAYRRGMQGAEESLSAQGIEGAELDRRAREAGRRTLVATVEQLTGARIDHFAEIGMAGFVELTEALGGVPVCLKAPVRDSYSGVDLPAGQHLVSGAGALAFVRQRHGLEDGDLDRIARQQAFAAGLAQRVLDPSTITDPARLERLVDITTRYVVLDSGWDLEQAVSQLRQVSASALTFHTIPTGRPDLHTPADGIAVEIDRDAVRSFVGSLLDPGTTPPATTPARPEAPTTARPAADDDPLTVQPADEPAGTGSPTPPSSSRPVITAEGVPCVD